MRHGLTIGELALLFNRYFEIGCDLEVVEMKNWTRKMYFMDTGLPWVPPSPNLPTPISVMVYPGQVLWEGTNISEGRGTAQPFEIFGAPFMDPQYILSETEGIYIPGAELRETAFEPTADKWKNRLCRGCQIHITNRRELRPYITGLTLLQAVIRHHRGQFEWKPPPYEYEFERLPMDLILGDTGLRTAIQQGVDILSLENSWQDDLEDFDKLRREVFLYN